MHILKSLKIIGSNFYKDCEFDFSPKLNCIMGGRGSGKTTAISLVGWALNHEQSLSKTASSAIKENLGGGRVELVIADSARSYLVTRYYGSEPTCKDDQNNVLAPNEMKLKFPIDFFATGVIEDIGNDPIERLRIFDSYVGDEIQKIKTNLNIIASKLNQNTLEIKDLHNSKKRIFEELEGYTTIAAEIDTLKKILENSHEDEELRKEFHLENQKQSNRTLEQNNAKKIESSISSSYLQAGQFQVFLKNQIDQITLSADFTAAGLDNVKSEILLAFRKNFDQNKEFMLNAERLKAKFESEYETYLKTVEVENIKFVELRNKLNSNSETYQKLNILTQKETRRKILQEQFNGVDAKIIEKENAASFLSEELKKVLIERLTLRQNKAEEINKKLGEGVRILIKECSINDKFSEIIRELLSAAQMRITQTETKILESSNPQELSKHVRGDSVDSYSLKYDISAERVRTLFDEIKKRGYLYSLDSCVSEDAPNFFLKVEQGTGHSTLKRTEELSAGQRCTTVLPIVFYLTNKPLIIDQPEDNLDNRYIIQTINEIIRNVKDYRQLIFVTHNPNIPVISDAEQNIFLSYGEKHSNIEQRGSINEVKKSIVDLLEGGEAAFKIRKQFYGY